MIDYTREQVESLQSRIETLEKQYAEGLAAWKLSNEWHGARIAELEAELAAHNAVKPECLR